VRPWVRPSCAAQMSAAWRNIASAPIHLPLAWVGPISFSIPAWRGLSDPCNIPDERGTDPKLGVGKASACGCSLGVGVRHAWDRGQGERAIPLPLPRHTQAGTPRGGCPSEPLASQRPASLAPTPSAAAANRCVMRRCGPRAAFGPAPSSPRPAEVRRDKLHLDATAESPVRVVGTSIVGKVLDGLHQLEDPRAGMKLAVVLYQLDHLP